MARFYKFFRKLFAHDDGPTAVEYAVMLSLIMAGCIPAIRSFGSGVSTMFSNIANSVASTGSGGSNGNSNNGGSNNTGGGNNGGGNNTGS